MRSGVTSFFSCACARRQVADLRTGILEGLANEQNEEWVQVIDNIIDILALQLGDGPRAPS